MKIRLSHGLAMLISALSMLILSPNAVQAQEQKSIVRMARLVIDPAQLEVYTAALKEEIEASIRIEPGVITLYAVAEKNNPSHITIFETYANQAAYQSHLETPHFKKYKSTTKEMVTSLELVEVNPVMLGAKKK